MKQLLLLTLIAEIAVGFGIAGVYMEAEEGNWMVVGFYSFGILMVMGSSLYRIKEEIDSVKEKTP